jgi:hypothetical protein
MADIPSPDRREHTGRSERTDRRERRVPAGPVGSLRWIKSILGRPLALERRADGLHVTLVDRRRSPEVIQAESMARLREELRLRLLSLDHEHAATAMRHLVFVHDVLGRQGWPGLQALNSRVLRRAGQQLQLLVEREPSARLVRFIDKLRLLQAGAEAREERLAAQARHAEAQAEVAGESMLEVSEGSVEDYEATQREWDATAPAPLDPPEPAERPTAA